MSIFQLHLAAKLRDLPHRIRVSWPLNRFSRSRDWELLILSYLLLVTLLLVLAFLLSHNTPHGL